MLQPTGRRGLVRLTRAALTAILIVMCAAAAGADDTKKEEQDPAAASPVVEFFKQIEVDGMVEG